MKKVKNILFVLFFLPVNVCIAQQNLADVIEKTNDSPGWIIKMRSSVYQITVTKEGYVKPVYYGPAGKTGSVKGAESKGYIDEVSVRGGLPFKTPMLEVIFPDGVRDADLVFVDGEIVKIDDRFTLKIIQRDRHYPLQVTSYIRVLPEFDMLEKWLSIKNTGKNENILVENLQSGNIALPQDEYELVHFAGKQEHEFQPQRNMLSPGLKKIQNKAFKANFNPPYFILNKRSSLDKSYSWFGALHYSGNWEIAFDKTFDGDLQVIAGINFWDTSLRLEPGKTFETPKFSIGFTAEGEQSASQNLIAYTRKTVLPENFRGKLRPILYNSWYATIYAVNESQQLDLARTAKDIGVEMFVIDDGWFKGRANHLSGLGDWEVDKVKFPNGLNPLIKKINEMGMGFGIWVEPESVNVNSDIYRTHPHWVMDFPNRSGNEHRKVLNLANEEVYQYLFNSLSKLLKEHNIKFVKWDQNNYLQEPGWQKAPDGRTREVRIRFIENLYRLVENLRKSFPDVWFESCASGAGRVDLGMLSRMDQAWGSDNVDPIDRLFIQYGYLSVLPANTMVSWTADPTRHLPIPLGFKFDVSMTGVLGIGNDLTKFSPAEIDIAKQKVEIYKQIRPLVQQGVLYKLISPFEENRTALQFNAENSDSAVLFCFNTSEYLRQGQFSERGSSIVRLKGLKYDAVYNVKILSDKETAIGDFSGRNLMDIGLDWPLKGAYKSAILLIKSRNAK